MLGQPPNLSLTGPQVSQVRLCLLEHQRFNCYASNFFREPSTYIFVMRNALFTLPQCFLPRDIYRRTLFETKDLLSALLRLS